MAVRTGQLDVGRRVGSGALVLLLHLLIVVALLRMVASPPPPPATSAREIFFKVMRSAPPAASSAPAPPLPRLIQPRRTEPQSIAPPLGGQTVSPDWRGLGKDLFGCAPEALAGMTPEERSHCTGRLTRPDDTTALMPQSHVKDPQRRAAEMRAKNRPGQIPCAIVMDTGAPGGGGAAPGVDPLCAIDGLINGFGSLNGLPK